MADDPGRVAELIGTMAALFPSVQMDPKSVRAYSKMLQDIPLPVLSAAIEQCSVESKFLPTVKEIRDKATALTRPEAPTALEAWGIVKKEIERVGYSRSPKFDDPVITRAVESIGWRELCNSENPVADRAHFTKVYEQLIQRREADGRLLPAARRLKEASGLPIIQQLMEAAPKRIGKK